VEAQERLHGLEILGCVRKQQIEAVDAFGATPPHEALDGLIVGDIDRHRDRLVVVAGEFASQLLGSGAFGSVFEEEQSLSLSEAARQLAGERDRLVAEPRKDHDLSSCPSANYVD
jgi:hypothetical protein